MSKDELVELYNGEVKLKIRHTKKHHYYKLMPDERKPLSVTQVTGIKDKSGPLMNWAVKTDFNWLRNEIKGESTLTTMEIEDLIEEARKQHRKSRDKAASIGDMVHDFAEKFANTKIKGGEEPEIPDNEKAINGINAFLDWYNSNDVEFVRAEKPVYSRENDYVGKLDLLAKIDGKLSVIDYKTSSGVYDTHYFQAAAYKKAFNEEMKFLEEETAGGLYILHFNKGKGEDDPQAGKFESIEIPEEEYKKDIEAFLSAKVLKERCKERYKIYKESKK